MKGGMYTLPARYCRLSGHGDKEGVGGGGLQPLAQVDCDLAAPTQGPQPRGPGSGLTQDSWILSSISHVWTAQLGGAMSGIVASRLQAFSSSPGSACLEFAGSPGSTPASRQ